MRTNTRLQQLFISLCALLFGFTLVPALALAAVDPVSILDNSYSPSSITVNQGDTVSWTDYGSVAHTVAADNGAFVSSSITPGVNFSYTFNTPGTYAYHDQSYGAAGGSGMAGTVTVVSPTSQTTTTSAGSSATAAGLAAQVQALIAEITQLQAQIGGGSSTGASTGAVTTVNSSACPNIGRVLSVGSTGADVSRLQQFLAQSPSIYPQGTVSGYFGALTQTAVERWQTQYNIVSSGSPSTTGYGVVGPRTAAAIALLCSTGSTTGGSTTTTTNAGGPTVGGVLQASPISGAAPLTVNIHATVNTVGSCAAASYSLDYGDGSGVVTIPTQAGNCEPVVQTYPHIYTAAGTYQITLSAGTHESTANITVTGALSPTQAAASGIPADSLHAAIASGPAPLSVVFTGTVSSIASYGCTGSCTDTINFGDGGVGLVQLPAAAGAWQSYIINHTYATAGTYIAQLESVTGAPDGPAITIHATGASSGSNATGGSYGIVNTPLPSSSALPVTQTATIALPACAPYQVAWGDNTALTTGTGACTQGGASATVSHQYTVAGTYTITLYDGSGNPKGNASVTIQ